MTWVKLRCIFVRSIIIRVIFFFIFGQRYGAYNLVQSTFNAICSPHFLGYWPSMMKPMFGTKTIRYILCLNINGNDVHGVLLEWKPVHQCIPMGMIWHWQHDRKIMPTYFYTKSMKQYYFKVCNKERIYSSCNYENVILSSWYIHISKYREISLLKICHLHRNVILP